MSTEPRTVDVGDRFETRDSRDQGRVVEVVECLGLDEHGKARLAAIEAGPETTWIGTRAQRIEWIRERHTHYRIRTEVHPNNPSAVGRRVRVQENTLREKYKRISR